MLVYLVEVCNVACHGEIGHGMVFIKLNKDCKLAVYEVSETESQISISRMTLNCCKLPLKFRPRRHTKEYGISEIKNILLTMCHLKFSIKAISSACLDHQVLVKHLFLER